jgi:hypothetical protein
MSQTRTTDRKVFIQQVLVAAGGRPLGEELRWRVLLKELREEKQPAVEMTESYKKSFCRTLRWFLPELAPGLLIHKIDAGQGWAAALLARVAVYRLDRYALLERFLNGESVSLHFWTNARTADVWQEGGDGEVEVQNAELLPEIAPDKIEPLYWAGGRWPRSSPQRQRGLEQLGPKYRKRPLICVRPCLGAAEVPTEEDILGTIRIPKNQPLSVVAPEPLDEKQLQSLADGRWALYLRRRGVTRVIQGKRRIV